jgi:enamine deaminase RidA (YjgF/YER057c/UK114 family)
MWIASIQKESALSTGMSSPRTTLAPHDPPLDPARFGLPYATAVRAGDFIFVSGLIAIDPATGERAHGTTVSETRLILSNLSQFLDGAGCSLGKVVKTTV